MLPSEIWKLPPDPPARGFPGDWKLTLLRLPSRDGSPSLALLSPFLSFNILSYLPSKTMGCFSGRLMSAASDQKLFCELCSPFNCSFHEFVGEKVVSPSYSTTIFRNVSILIKLFDFSFWSFKNSLYILSTCPYHIYDLQKFSPYLHVVFYFFCGVLWYTKV